MIAELESKKDADEIAIELLFDDGWNLGGLLPLYTDCGPIIITPIHIHYTAALDPTSRYPRRAAT